MHETTPAEQFTGTVQPLYPQPTPMPYIPSPSYPSIDYGTGTNPFKDGHKDKSPEKDEPEEEQTAIDQPLVTEPLDMLELIDSVAHIYTVLAKIAVAVDGGTGIGKEITPAEAVALYKLTLNGFKIDDLKDHYLSIHAALTGQEFDLNTGI